MTKTLFTTSVTVDGGREGTAISADGNFTVDIAMPGTPRAKKMPEATNPEQLFAAGYAACFDSALQSVGKIAGVTFTSNVTASVSLLMGDMHQYSLAVTLSVRGSGVDKQTFETLVHKAHQMCPYSKAISGNVDVSIEVAVD